MATAAPLRIPVVVDGRTAVASFDEVRAAAARARQEIADQVAGSARLQAQAGQAAAELERRRIALVIQGIEDVQERRVAQINLTAALEAQAIEKLIAARLKAGEIDEARAASLRSEFDRVAEAARRANIGQVENQLGGIQRQGRNAGEAVVSLARGLEDASFAGGDFAQIVRFSGNNVSQFVTQLGHAKREAAAVGTTVSRQLVASLAGPAGLVLATSLLTAGLPILIQKLRDSEAGFAGSAEAARDARDAYREAYESAIALSFAQEATLEAQARIAGARFRASQSRVLGIRSQIRDLEDERDQLEAQAQAARDSAARRAQGQGGPAAPFTEADARRLRAVRGEITQLSESLGRFETIADDASEALGRIGAERDAQSDIESLGLDAESIAEGAADAGRQAGRALGRGAAEGAREVSEEVGPDLARVLQVEEDLRIEALETARERELDSVRRTLEERLAVIREAYGEGSDLELVAIQTAAAAAEAVNREYTARAVVEAERLADARLELQLRFAAVMGATEEEILEARLDALRRAGRATADAELALIEFRTAAREADAEAALEGLIERLDRETQAWADAETDRIELERRAAAERLRIAERYVDQALDAIRSAFEARRRFTEEEVDAEREAFDAREADLEASLRRRRVTQEQFDAEMRALAADRAEFEAAVAEDSASRAVRAIGALAEFAREAAVDFIQAQLARAVASAIASAFTSVPFPFNIAAAGIAAAAAVAAGALVPAFAEGGPVHGPGGPTDDRVLARLSAGEHVLTAAEVAALGGHHEVERFRRLAVTGRLPAFAGGGPVLGRPPLPALAAGTAGGAGPLVGEIRALRQDLAAQSAELARLGSAPVVVGDAAARGVRSRAAQSGARRLNRAVVPRKR